MRGASAGRLGVVVLSSLLGVACELISGVSDLEVVDPTGSGGSPSDGGGGAGAGSGGIGPSGGNGGQGGNCEEPGTLGGACCDGACEEGVCVDDLCVACGAIDEPCCAANACGTGLTCSGGTCGGCIAQIEAAAINTCARLVDGTVRCAGVNLYGELGIGTQTPGPHPVPNNIPPVTDVVRIEGDHGGGSCVIDSAGTLSCWGDNGYGQIGVGPALSEHPDPTVVASLAGPVTSVGLGSSHTCAFSGGASYCWGNTYRGSIGDGGPVGPTEYLPVATVPFGVVTEWALGSSRTCARTDASDVWCWGANDEGQLGNGGQDDLDHPTPTELPSLAGTTVDIASTLYTACAVSTTGELRCWGENGFDEGGNPGGSFDIYTPTLVEGLTGVDQVDGGGFHFCALQATGGVSCWGRNYEGQIGAGVYSYSFDEPNPVAGLPSDIVEVTTGYAHSCARTANGMAYCWGRNDFGQLASGVTSDAESTPQAVAIVCP